jgi:PhzF family phenazine biosynthesis protein
MKYFVVDAFTDKPFCGNPAGVCPMDQWPADETMQRIAFENNLSETAFLVKRGNGVYGLRWFSVEEEIDLCGHATLASTFVLSLIDPFESEFAFETKSGLLKVKKAGGLFYLDFPSRKAEACAKPETLERALGAKVLETHRSRDLVALVSSAEVVLNLKPDFALLRGIEAFAVAVTAKGTDCDFVSRFFAPNAGMNEDPVTGSSHCTLIPFWKERLLKTEMVARQLSYRGGTLFCRDLGDRVEIGGSAVLYMVGEIRL